MTNPFRLLVLFALGLPALTAVEASAQPLGTFRWQLLPYCNVVTLHVTQAGTVLRLDGFDDQCGAGQRASVVGTAFFNPDGTVGIGLNTVVADGSGFVHVDARIGLASLGGSWRDTAGNTGSLVFAPGGGIGGAPRPPPSGTIARIFAPSEVSWNPIDLGGINLRQATLSVPAITNAVTDRGGVQVFVGLIAFDEPWTALPFTTFGGSTTASLFYSVAPGGVVLRFHSSDNVAPPPLFVPVKVVVTP